MKKWFRWNFFGLLLVLFTHVNIHAEVLRFGLKTEPTSLDPHFHILTPNIQVAHHIFGYLTTRNDKMEYKPDLAESWKIISDNEWEFKLRKNVKFSDGSEFTAKDVVYSINRARVVPNSPSSFKTYLSSIKEMKIIDPHTIRFITSAPTATMLINVSYIAILSHKSGEGSKAAEGVTTQQLNAGQGLIGTGPYKFVSWKRGTEIVLEKNPNFWGSAPKWDKVQMKVLTNPSTRLNALLSGSVDLIESIPTEDIASLRKNPKISVFETPSVRVIYVGLMQGTNVPVGVSGTNGKNPFTDIRVRQAMSLAIDRRTMIQQIMAGSATMAGDIIIPSLPGHRAVPVYPEYNVEKAKKLLTEAGYPNGFNIEFLVPSGRYVNDADIAQALAMFWGKIGIKVKVNAQVTSVFFSAASTGKFGVYMAGWGDSDITQRQWAIFHTRSTTHGGGTGNFHGYSNAKADALIVEANRTLDDAKRMQLHQKITTMVLDEDFGLMPLYFENSVWAVRKGIQLTPRPDQFLYAQDIR